MAGARDPASRERSELTSRVLVAVPAVVVAIVMIIQGGWIFAVGIGLLGLVCLHELYSLYEHTAPVKLAGFAALMGMVVAARLGDERQVLLALVAFVPVLFLFSLTMTRTDPLGFAVTTLGVVWVGLAVAHVVLLRDTEHGDAILVDILVGTFIGDSAAYLGGRSFGRRPLAARISPNKTVEGLLIGMVVAIVATWAAGLYQDWLPGWHALLIGAVVAVLAPLGDLFESRIKRGAGAKDAGSLFGVHGGALDRLDAAIFTVVGGYYVWLALS